MSNQLWFGTLSATVRVEDLPASRRVVAIELPADGQWRVCGAGTSNASGVATLSISGLPTSRIYAVAIDDWGQPFVPSMNVSPGDVIRPTQFVGWMYQVTAGGVLPGTEPEWWDSMAGIPQPVGTAMLQAVRHYQPIAHGPVADIVWQEMEFDPYWAQVVSLLHFEGDLADEKGVVWGGMGTPAFPSVWAEFGQQFQSGGGKYARSDAHSVFHLGALDFTLEFFVSASEYVDGSVQKVLFSKWGGESGTTRFGYMLDIYQGALRLLLPYNASNAVFAQISHPMVFSAGIRRHICVERHSGKFWLYVDGQSVGSVTAHALPDSTPPFMLGYKNDGMANVENFPGYFDEFRLTKGVARYAGNFTPPTGPFPNIGPPL